MLIQKDISLKKYNTFGIDVTAKHFIAVNTINELIDVLKLNNYPDKFILGGGSNILLTKNINALVIHINLKGKKIVSKTESSIIISSGAGENWHEFVLWCINNGYGGLENLSLIPGNVGTSPIQNIGAYGVELKDHFVSCKVIDLESLELKTFNNTECRFGYRDSIFKQNAKGRYIITSVNFKLTTKNHNLRTNYGAIQEELNTMGTTSPSIQDISKAVIKIRESKLPNPKKIGNSGSFFKNPIINKTQFEALVKQFPDVPSYKLSEEAIKIPAGWLIEKAGFKGKTFNNYGVHKKQALVLVNYGGSKGKDILKLAKLIQETIYRIFGVSIETEVNIL